MYSAHNEGKSVVAERFIRTLKNKIYKYKTSISKNVYIDELDDIVNKYHNIYDGTIKWNLLTLVKKLIIKILNLKLVILLEHQNLKHFGKGYVRNWSEEVFVIKKVKNTVPWTYVVSDLKGEELVGTFYEKELNKRNQEEFRVNKVIKKKGDKLYLK